MQHSYSAHLISWSLTALASLTAASCTQNQACPEGQIEREGRCYGDCRRVAPPCWAEDGGLVLSDASDGSTDGAPACEAGASACDGECVSLASDTRHCGACGRACSGGPGARAICAMGQCSTECLPGYERVGAACEMKAPRLLSPMSTSYVSSHRPTLRWEQPAGLDGATIELCASRDCSMVLQRAQLDRAMGSWRVERALGAGVYWWRVRGRVGSSEGVRTSATWEFVVSVRDRVTDTHWGTMTDVNGDGFGDLVVGDPQAMDDAGAFAVHRGSAVGPLQPATWGAMGMLAERMGASVGGAGDVNGDGFSDVIVGAPGARDAMTRQTGAAIVYLGGASGLDLTGVRLFGAEADEEFGAAVSAAGDVDGDGYGDVLVGAPGAAVGGIAQVGRVYVFRGGPTGIAREPTTVLDGRLRVQSSTAFVRARFGARLAGAIDGEGDRYADIVVGAPLTVDFEEGDGDVGMVRYYRGGPMGLSTTPTREWMRLEPAGSIVPNGGAFWGASVSAAGDINGDGYGDFVFGGSDPRRKRDAFWVPGGASGVAMTPTRISTPGAMDGSVGRVVAGGGDVNGDGFDDVLIVANERIGFLFHGGAVRVELSEERQIDLGERFFFRDSAMLDLDRDQRSDVLISYGNSCIAMPCRAGIDGFSGSRLPWIASWQSSGVSLR